MVDREMAVRAPPAPVAGLVERPCLFDTLDRGAAGPATLVCGPAGSGKSMLVSSWLESRGPRNFAGALLTGGGTVVADGAGEDEHEARRTRSPIASTQCVRVQTPLSMSGFPSVSESR